jgi:hypothetical protein
MPTQTGLLRFFARDLLPPSESPPSPICTCAAQPHWEGRGPSERPSSAGLAASRPAGRGLLWKGRDDREREVHAPWSPPSFGRYNCRRPSIPLRPPGHVLRAVVPARAGSSNLHEPSLTSDVSLLRDRRTKDTCHVRPKSPPRPQLTAIYRTAHFNSAGSSYI